MENVAKAPSLSPFDGSKPLIVQGDASQTGLGAVLLQEGRPVAAASRHLTQTEQNYAQIEKEMLALLYAAQEFDKFIYGMPRVTFQTDHKPPVSISKQQIHQIENNRLKTMRLKLLRFNLQVQYRPGKFFYLTDLLSRDYIEGPVDEDPDLV